MPITVAGTIQPSGNFPVVDIDHVKGGLMIKADIAARDAIPSGNRKSGMRVHVLSTGLTYSLGVDLLTWLPVIMSTATAFDLGLVKPDGVTITVDLQGRLTALVPKFSSTLGSVLASVGENGDIIFNMNWDGKITNWTDIDTDDDASVVTIGNLKALSVLPP